MYVSLHHMCQIQLLAVADQGGGVQCFMQRPVHPSYGRVKQNVDLCLFVWTGQDG